MKGPVQCLPCPPDLPTGHTEPGHQAFADIMLLPDMLSLSGLALRFLIQENGVWLGVEAFLEVRYPSQ